MACRCTAQRSCGWTRAAARQSAPLTASAAFELARGNMGKDQALFHGVPVVVMKHA